MQPSLPPWPRERLISAGPSALSDAELLALLLGTGRAGEPVSVVGERLLLEAGGLRALAEAHPRELTRLVGLGVAKAARLLAAIEIGRRVCSRPWELGEPFLSSRQVFAHYHPRLRDEKRERFFAVFLDARNRRLGEREISRGSLVASLVHPREVFRPAIRAAAASLICLHNHPSGDPTCSAEDRSLTRRLHRVGETIGIPLIDHIIVGDGTYMSFVDQGIAPFGAPPPAAPPEGRGTD